MDPYLALKVVFIATFSLLKRSKSVYLTFIQRNSHYAIMATSVSLFSCHILTKKPKFYRSLAKISLCRTSIQYFNIINDLIITSQQYIHIILITANFISTNGFSAFYTFTGRISNGFPLVNHLYRKVN